MKKSIKLIIVINLLAVTALTILYAHKMVSPGKLIAGHQSFEKNCFDCHTLFVGISERKCIKCHELSKIGLFDTKGNKLDKKAKKTTRPFHHELRDGYCVEYHTDHAGMIVYRRFDYADELEKIALEEARKQGKPEMLHLFRQRFSHGLIKETKRKVCTICHEEQKDDKHRNFSKDCGQCHTFDKWKPAKFNHDMIMLPKRNDCMACHKKELPKDIVHRNAPTDCKQCHTFDKWKPAKFNHDFETFPELLNCIACHKPKQPRDIIHRNASDQCGLCHSAEKWKPALFKHEIDKFPEIENCIACHKPIEPVDIIHRNASQKCGQCHSFDNWKTKTFEHDLVSFPELKQCTACHKNKKPDDTMHRNVTQECGQCHGTKKWKPATYNHDRFFVFDKHHKRCTTCHRIPSYKKPDYKKYTCYFCHAHSKGGIRASHRKKGMRNINKCTDCHRNTSKREAKKAWESIKRGIPYQFPWLKGKTR